MHTTRTRCTICLLLQSVVTAFSLGADVAGPETTVTHRLELTDPVTPAEPARTYSVVQTRDGNGFPTGYRMSFETPVCIDEQCRIVQCTMVWNGLGYYQRLEYPADTPLTKRKHVPFAPEDYTRLDQILKDRTSVLGTISLETLVPPAPKDASPEEVVPDNPLPDGLGIDGWSGATPLTVKEAVVVDAAYTSWAMWRWANGEIVPKLQELTRHSCTPDYLRHLLHSEDRRDLDFALRFILDHCGSDRQFTQDVLRVLETADREHVTLSLDYLDRVPPSKRTQLQAKLVDACCRMKDNCSPMVLDYFATSPELPSETLEALTGILDQLPYFQIHLILRMLDQKGFFSKQAESNIARLLDNENFFIARRAYEHLAKQVVSAETAVVLQAFRQKHHDRL